MSLFGGSKVSSARGAALTAGSFGAAAFGVLALFPVAYMASGRVVPRVSICGVPLGGKDQEECTAALAQALPSPTLRLLTEEDVWSLSLEECGGAYDLRDMVARAVGVGRKGSLVRRHVDFWRSAVGSVDLPASFTFESRSLRSCLRRIAHQVNRPAVDATIRITPWGFVVRDGRLGARMEVACTARRVSGLYSSDRTTIVAGVKTVQPYVRAEDLRQINCRFSRFRTWFNPGKINRSANIRTVCRLLDGAVCQPGDVFSFNRTTGERTVARGFKVAIIFEQRKEVPGVGGGVCQVATTLYNTALAAGLPILERHPHSLPVTYVRHGRDATVAYPGRDLKFKNTTTGPIFIHHAADHSSITAAIYGVAGARRRPGHQLRRGTSDSILGRAEPLFLSSPELLWMIRRHRAEAAVERALESLHQGEKTLTLTSAQTSGAQR